MYANINGFYGQFALIIQAIAAAGFGAGIMPIIVSIITQAHWPKEVKEVVVLLSCIAISILGGVVLNIDFGNLVVVIPTMLFSARLAYQQYWKPTGLAPWIEDATTIR